VTKRLVWSYVALAFVVTAALALPLGATFASRERDRLFRDIEHDATVVAALSEDSLEQGTRPPIDATLQEYAKNPGGRIVVVDVTGHSVADSARPAHLGDDFRNRPEIRAAIGGERAEGQRHSDTLHGDLLYVAVPIASSGTVHGAVRVTYPSSTLDERVRNLWAALGGLALMAIIAAAGIGFGLAQLVTRPVARLKAAATQLAAGDFSARAATDAGAPELRELAEVFNHSADQVQASLAAQQAFVADASHQLRSPLAALRLQLENVESAASPDLQPEVAAARAETARLTRITDTLLALARVPSATAAVVPVDVSPIAHERVTVWTPMAEDLGAGLALSVPEHLWVLATREAVEHILDNLIDNALDVAPPGSSVEISGVADSQGVMIRVSDRGPGLDAEQRARAFDRFWRGPDAAPGGTGLGLAIVAQLASACGGRAELRARDGGGIDAIVVLRVTKALPRSNDS
jgi:signal transduction histidine kinase